MKTRKSLVIVLVLLLCLAGSLFAQAQRDIASYPSRPIDIMLGWSAGGTSDTTVRAVVPGMSEYLGVDIRVVNMEGANGGIAYQNVYSSAADGYRWFGGAEVQATYPITKQANVGWERFYAFPAGMGGTTIYVRSDSGYKTIEDLVNFIKRSPRVVNYGTTSRGGNGHIFGEAFTEIAGVADKVRDIPYDGGREAGNYLIAGEVEFISVSLGDVSDWAEEGTLKPLLNLYSEDFHWRGVTFPSVNNHYPELEIYSAINPYWGIAIHRDTPEEIVVKIAEAFTHAVKGKYFNDMLESRAIIPAPLMGKAADHAVALVGSGRGWAQYDYGIVDTKPSDFNIPRLEDWKFPYDDLTANIRPWPVRVEELYSSLK
jgi:tripartite-type tricarboxylate transporter receptor subunit TctC